MNLGITPVLVVESESDKVFQSVRVDADAVFHDVQSTIASFPNLAIVGGTVHMFTATWCDVVLTRNCETAFNNRGVAMEQLIEAMRGTTGLVVATLWIAVRDPETEPRAIRGLRRSLRAADWDSTSTLITNCLHGGQGWTPPDEMDEGNTAVAEVLDEGEPNEAQFMLLDMFDVKQICEPLPTGTHCTPR
eukprot:scaffold108524_cov37-Attheya_sp.AAC.1